MENISILKEIFFFVIFGLVHHLTKWKVIQKEIRLVVPVLLKLILLIELTLFILHRRLSEILNIPITNF